MAAGRPTIKTNELIDEMLERIADGESLRSICRDDHMPNKATVFRWLTEDAEFNDQYAKARESQADSFVDDMLEIVDDTKLQSDPSLAAVARLRLDARKWIASKLKSKSYGDKVQQEVSGDLGLTVNIHRFGSDA